MVKDRKPQAPAPYELPRAEPDPLPLPDPYPEYITCPVCGELEVEIWCYEESARCHACGSSIRHARPACFGKSPLCGGLSGQGGFTGDG